MGFGMLLFWGLIIAGIVLLAGLFGGRAGEGGGGTRQKTPLEILAERYARGEIDRNEFEHKRRDLQAG